MMWAQRTGRAHRTSGALALHVLELMTATLASSRRGPARRSHDDVRPSRAVAGRARAEHVRRLRRATAVHGADSSMTGTEMLRYGIVGGGFVSGFHLRALESVRGIEVAGITSRTPPGRARRRRLGARVWARRASSTASARWRAHVDVVAIFSPNFARLEVMEEVAAAVARRRLAARAHLREAARRQPPGGAPRRRARRRRSARRPRTSRTRST